MEQCPVLAAFHIGQRRFGYQMSEMVRPPPRREDRGDFPSVSLKGRVVSFPGLPRTPNLRSYAAVWSLES